jgi:hypothetical protein
VPQEEAGEEEAVVLHQVGVDMAGDPEKVAPQDLVKPIYGWVRLTSITMPMELVEEEEWVVVVVQMVDPDLVPGLAVAPAQVLVDLLAMGMPMPMVMVGVRDKVLDPMGLAEKELERVVVKDMVLVL